MIFNSLKMLLFIKIFSFQQFENFKCLKLNEKSWRLSDRVNKQSESTVPASLSQLSLVCIALSSRYVGLSRLQPGSRDKILIQNMTTITALPHKEY